MNMEKITETLTEIGTTWGLRVVGVLVALLIARMLANWSKKAIVRTLTARSFDETLTKFFGNVARYSILGGAVLGCLGVFGIETASFAAVIAAMGLAVGLAFQGTLSNFSAGVMLLVFRPFKVGDFVDAGGVTGFVSEIELFTTEIKSLDNKRLIVPNSAIFGSTIRNFTHFDQRRVDVDVGTDYGADLRQVRDVLEGMIADIPGVLSEPAPQVFLGGLGASSIDWQVRVWCNTPDYWDVYQATVLATKEALDAAEIGIPFPQTDVHFDPEAIAAFSGKKAA